MPALKDTAPHAALTTPARRRIWTFPDLKSHSLLVLTPDRLYLAPLAGPPRPEVVAAAEAGADLDDLFGPLATAVDLAAVRRVRLDLVANSLILEYVHGYSGRSRLTVAFAAPGAADACFTKLWRRLGDGCELVPYQQDWWALTRAPLTVLGFVLAATAVLALALTVFDDAAAGRGVASVNVPGAEHVGGPVVVTKGSLAIPAWLGWRAVCVGGGAAAAALQVWLYRRLTRPPEALELARA